MWLITGEDEAKTSGDSRSGLDPYPSEKLKTLAAVMYSVFGEKWAKFL